MMGSPLPVTAESCHLFFPLFLPGRSAHLQNSSCVVFRRMLKNNTGRQKLGAAKAHFKGLNRKTLGPKLVITEVVFLNNFFFFKKKSPKTDAYWVMWIVAYVMFFSCLFLVPVLQQRFLQLDAIFCVCCWF